MNYSNRTLPSLFFIFGLLLLSYAYFLGEKLMQEKYNRSSVISQRWNKGIVMLNQTILSWSRLNGKEWYVQ
jgi:hypothetical protein